MNSKIVSRLVFLLAMLLSLNAYSQSLAIVLKLNDENESRVYHDEPLLMSLSITNQLAQENNRWNKAADRRLKELEELIREKKISQEEYEKEKNDLQNAKRPVPVITVGDAGTPWPSLVKWKLINKSNGITVAFNIRKMPNPSSDEIAILNERGYYTAYFGIDAAEMRKITAGTYEIIAEFSKEESQPASLEIRSESLPPGIADSEPILLRNGQYWWHAGDSKQGLKFAERILQKNPVSLDGLSLKGDLQLLDSAFLPALDTFNKALKEFYRQNPVLTEPPEYILAMIDWIKTQIR